MKTLFLTLAIALSGFAQTSAPLPVSTPSLYYDTDVLPRIDANASQAYLTGGQQVTSLPSTGCSLQNQTVVLVSGGSASRYYNTAANGVSACSWSIMQQATLSTSGFSAGEFTNVTFPRVFGSALAIGTTDLYGPVATGKRLYVGSCFSANPASGAVTWNAAIKVGSTYYSVTTPLVINATTVPGTQVNIDIALEPGETLAVQTTTTAGLNLACGVWLADSSSKIRTVKLVGLATGNNTVFTATDTRGTLMLGTNAAASFGFTSAPGGLVFVNDSGGPHTTATYQVPSGGSASNANIISQSVGVAASQRTNGTAISTNALAPGDSVVINVDAGAATQVAWVNVWEP